MTYSNENIHLGGIDPRITEDLVEETITIAMSTVMEELREDPPKEDASTDWWYKHNKHPLRQYQYLLLIYKIYLE